MSDVSAKQDEVLVNDKAPVIQEDVVQPKPAQILTAKPKDDVDVKPAQSADEQLKAFESKLLRLEKLMSIGDQSDILDVEIVTDLLVKGWTVQDLRAQKPYLFKVADKSDGQSDQSEGGQKVKQIIAPMQKPKVDDVVDQDQFVKDLVESLKITNF